MSILDIIINKYKSIKQNSFNKKDLRAKLIKALQDGILTTEEINQLEEMRSQYGLRDKDFINKRVKKQMYSTAFTIAKDDNLVSLQEEEHLDAIQDYLGLKHKDVAPQKKIMKDLRLKKFANKVLASFEKFSIDEDTDQLNAYKESLGISDADISSRTSIYIYAFAFDAVKQSTNNNITKQHKQEFNKLQKFLSIDNQSITQIKKELDYFSILTEIQLGNLPEVHIPRMSTKTRELIHWKANAALLELRVVYKATSYSSSVKDLLPISQGEFIITNKRLIFRGNGKNLTIPLSKVVDYIIQDNHLELTEDGKIKGRVLKFGSSSSIVITDKILEHLLV